MDVLNGVACATLHSILTQSGQITCHWKLTTIIETLICKLSSLGLSTDPVQLDPWLLDWRIIVKIHDQTSHSGTLSSSALQRHLLNALLAHNIFCLHSPGSQVTSSKFTDDITAVGLKQRFDRSVVTYLSNKVSQFLNVRDTKECHWQYTVATKNFFYFFLNKMSFWTFFF